MKAKLTGIFTETGISDEIDLFQHFNLELTFSSTGTVTIERKLVGGSAFVPIESITESVSKRGYEAEQGTRYRLNCSAIAGSATINYRLSR